MYKPDYIWADELTNGGREREPTLNLTSFLPLSIDGVFEVSLSEQSGRQSGVFFSLPNVIFHGFILLERYRYTFCTWIQK